MESNSKEKALQLDAVFPTIEDFISQKKDADYKCGSKRKLLVEHPNLSSVFTPEWRKAVCRFAENIPMGLLIQEFNRFYSIPVSKETSEQDSKALRKHGKLVDFPYKIMANILLRSRLSDVLVSRDISDDWAAVYASQKFRARFNKTTEEFIVINNKNLDIWAFSVSSKRWILLKIPCDWEDLGVKTLGVKATSYGLVLVGRSDFNLFVVNPVTAQFERLPRIFPVSEDRVEFLQSLIVHGTAEMKVYEITGNYAVYLLGNCHDKGESCLQLARYTSTTKLWTIQQISLHGVPLSSTSFPSPLWSFRTTTISPLDTAIVCVSSACQYISCFCNNNQDVRIGGCPFLNIPATIELKKPNCTLPIMVPYIWAPRDSGLILVGRLKEDDSVKGMFGKLPIVNHFSLCIWKFDQTEWELIDTINVKLMEDMIKSSEGTDFVVVGDLGGHTIWLMLRGSESMLQYDLQSHEILFLPGCPGGGYMNTNFHWKADRCYFNFNKIGDPVSAPVEEEAVDSGDEVENLEPVV